MSQLTTFTQTLGHPFSALLDWVYPRLCLACTAVLPRQEPYFCLHCQAHLPETDLHRQTENEFTDRFEQRVANLVTAAAMYHFQRGSAVQQLVHQIKYNDQREAARAVGALYGARLQQIASFRNADAIIPVPMHPKKLHQRGYNQAALFAEGLATALEIPVWHDALRKNRETASQTHKTRVERAANVVNAFSVSLKYTDWAHKHVIIADDVMTSGATLEACAAAIATVAPTTQISFVTLAIAQF